MGNSPCCDEQKKPDFSKPLPKDSKTQRKMPPRQNYEPFKQQKTNRVLQKPTIARSSQQSALRVADLPVSLEKVSKAPNRPSSIREESQPSALEEQLKIKAVHSSQDLRMTQPTSAVSAVLQSQNFFTQQLPKDPKKKQLGLDYYEGELCREGKLPQGYGKLFKADGSVYVGQFYAGEADGDGAYVYPDGTYYVGQFRKNVAEGEKGRYVGSNFEYNGQFQNNQFHGDGVQSSSTYTYTGSFVDNHRNIGEIEWREGREKYRYKGAFNERNEFHGQGILYAPKGMYKGRFQDGHKHGKGQFLFKNGLKFLGEYKNGVRQGHGALYNPGPTLVYEGSFEDGMPHGKGQVLGEDNLRQSTHWVRGISCQLIDMQQD